MWTGHSSAYFPTNYQLISLSCLTQQRVKSHRCSFPCVSHILSFANYSFTLFSEALGVGANNSCSPELFKESTPYFPLYISLYVNNLTGFQEDKILHRSSHHLSLSVFKWSTKECRNNEEKHKLECALII